MPLRRGRSPEEQEKILNRRRTSLQNRRFGMVGTRRYGNFASHHSRFAPEGEWNVLFSPSDPGKEERSKITTDRNGDIYRYPDEDRAATDARLFHAGEKEAYVYHPAHGDKEGKYTIIRVDNGRPLAEAPDNGEE